MAAESESETAAGARTDTDVRSPSRLGYESRERLLKYGLYGAAAALLVFLWVPLLVMMFLSVAQNASTLFPFEGFTLSHYAATFADTALMGSLWTSVQIATVSAIIATVLGVAASFALARHDFPLKEVYRTSAILPMVVPGIILGIALLIFYQTVLGFTMGFGTIVLTHSVYGLPFVVLIVTARLYSFDESLEEAARDLGADPVETFRDVTLPIVAPAVGAGFLFAWIRSFEDFIRAFFVRGTTDVLTTSMFSMIKYGTAPKMNAISSFIVFVIAIVLAVAMNLGNVTGYVAGTVDEEN
ncbi:ABC transporter permease [Halogeometricum borinquense]|uniref:ABC-type spermidine/putrescine transport system, permease component II n=2 Tax=Halogeometricum borinquense TaxID=60847 RepID=E4NLK4_HALBP|nr:ABC transporter permease [Halogeometricum borinquense]ADQ67207.1 ABC-type spermidine/putrescine transport system, permease component II [Halogeometricum borinquense DSM 11551]ELY29754.1 spermidine/putrescine ABC transporter permease ii [Halogeometricum borinquense DSM 11551]QIB74558.1 ABC transporter permease [Halogeometricum borinquense]QIQ76497.1 ABC transporter permease [Halogeometricum borinquense]RYJ13840.1 ABC transporter permease [Halogeometricum borinquense]